MGIEQWRAVHGSKGSIASVVKKRKEKNAYINNLNNKDMNVVIF
jgi:hypothetical protein